MPCLLLWVSGTFNRIGYMVLQVGFLFEDAHRRREKRELSNMAAQFAEDSQCEALYMWLERRDDASREQVRYVCGRL